MEANGAHPTKSWRQLIVMIIGLSHLSVRALAYASQSPVDPYTAALQSNLRLPSLTEASPTSSPAAAASRTSRARYDLGLGRHPPVAHKHSGRQHSNAPRDVYDAVQFWVEHEAVTEYPSPQRNQRVCREQDHRSSSLPTQSLPSKSDASISKRVPFVRPKRLSPDLIEIRASRIGCGPDEKSDGRCSDHHPVATIKPQTHRPGQLELNTAWVEMLIHEQLQSIDLSSCPQPA